MAELITLRDNSVSGDLVAADLNGEALWSSSDQTNVFQQDLYQGVKLTCTFDNLVASGGTVRIAVVIEAKDLSGNYHPEAYSFNPYRGATGQKEFFTVVADPGAFTPDLGVSNIIYFNNRVIGEVSTQQIALPETWRVCLLANIPPNVAFTSVSADVSAELVNKEV